MMPIDVVRERNELLLLAIPSCERGCGFGVPNLLRKPFWAYKKTHQSHAAAQLIVLHQVTR